VAVSKAAAKQAAMVKSRERRAALDEDRAARDRRVEEATSQVLLQLEERAAAAATVQAANAEIGVVLGRLLDDEGIAWEGVASLVDLTVSEVRRLARAVPAVAGDGHKPGVGGNAVAPAAGGHLAAVPTLDGEAPDDAAAAVAD